MPPEGPHHCSSSLHATTWPQSINYTSIDPKRLQNDSFRPISVKNRFLGTPYFHPKSKLLHQCIFVGVDIAICSATLLSSKPGHRDQPQSSGARPRQGQEEDKAQPQSPAQRTRGGQEPSKPSTAHEHARSPCCLSFFLSVSLSLSLCLSLSLSLCERAFLERISERARARRP